MLHEWAGIIATVCSTVVIVARMRRYVTVDEYRAKVATLHAEINELRVKAAVAEERSRK